MKRELIEDLERGKGRCPEKSAASRDISNVVIEPSIVDRMQKHVMEGI